MTSLAGHVKSAMTKATVEKIRNDVDNFGLNDVVTKTTATKGGKKLSNVVIR